MRRIMEINVVNKTKQVCMYVLQIKIYMYVHAYVEEFL
jgi:hypothetical protein